MIDDEKIWKRHQEDLVRHRKQAYGYQRGKGLGEG